MLKNTIEQLVKDAIAESIANQELGSLNTVPELVPIDRTKNPEHGDRAINIAMKLSKEAKLAPASIANIISSKLKSSFEKIEIAGPGFINLSLGWGLLETVIDSVLAEAKDYGKSPRSPEPNIDKILIEYVSANPTGDLHIGHGRQAVLGSSLASLLSWAGYQIATEFYINDAGAQILKLGNSAKQAVLIQEGLLDKFAYDESNYPLDSMLEFIKPEKYKQLTSNKELEELDLIEFANFAKQIFLDAQQEILQNINVEFDNWYSEKSNLHRDSQEGSKVDQCCIKLTENGFAYEADNALWFRAKELGDERDRVLRKSDGSYTYLAADLAYHQNKFSRGFDKLINPWGADHHGQIPGIKGGLKALGFDPERLEIILIQLVSLTKGGQEVKMSKRSGDLVTVQDLVNEVGVDAFRYFLVESQANNRIVFDIELAKKQDKDNPVYYIQYAHARCSSILRMLTNKGIDGSNPLIDNLAESISIRDCFQNKFVNLNEEEKRSIRNLILHISEFPELITDAALTRSPYKVAIFLKDLATLFHQFYTHNRVITDDKDLMIARLKIVVATKQVLHNALSLLGISAPEQM